MAAAAFTETLLFQGMKDGTPRQIRATVSDVVGQYAVFPDGNDFLQLPGDQPYILRDIIVVTGGTDTSNQLVFANGLDTGLVIDNKSNLNSSNNRQFQQMGIPFKPGALLRFKQAA